MNVVRTVTLAIHFYMQTFMNHSYTSAGRKELLGNSML